MSRPSATAVRASRTLFLINDLRMGGAERSLVNFVNHVRHVRAAVVLIESAADLLFELRPDLELFALDRGGTTPLGRREIETLAADAPRRRGGQPRGRMLFELPALVEKARRLARIARATDATVISTFLNRSHTIALLSKTLFAPRMRIVINVHEMLSDHLERYFSTLEQELMRAFIRRKFPRAETIVAVSEGVKLDLVRHFSIAPDRITVVPNPVDLERIRRLSAERIEGDETYRASGLIVAVGRLVPLKGFDLLIRAFARLRQSLHTRLLIIGEGDQRAALERLIAELDLSDRVVLLGTQTNPWKYMARADVVALASRSEASPNVIGEALALARPVIATNCSPGIAEYLDGGRYGVLVPPDDVGALTAGLERILTDDDLRHGLMTRAAARADSFDLHRVVERYEQLLVDAARE